MSRKNKRNKTQNNVNWPLTCFFCYNFVKFKNQKDFVNNYYAFWFCSNACLVAFKLQNYKSLNIYEKSHPLTFLIENKNN